MVPRTTKPGRSFTGAWAYYLHDKRDAAQIERGEGQHTAARVEWCHIENMARVKDERAAIGLMIDTARQNRRCEKPVYAFSLGWHPEQKPERAEMIEAGRAALKALGMEDHQAVFVAHNDTAHKHVHVIVNRVHPETLKAANNYRDQEKLSAWALEQERAQNRIYCKAREHRENFRNKIAKIELQAQQKPQQARYVDNTLAECWTRSDSGKSFLTALEAKGWKLAKGDRKENVVMAVTPSGRAFAVLRELNKGLAPGRKLKGEDLDRKLADLNRELLPSVEQVQGAIAEERPRRAKTKVKEKEQTQTEARRPEEQQWVLDMRIREERRKLQERHERERQEQQDKAAAKIDAARREAEQAQRIGQKRAAIKALEARLHKGGFFYRVSGKAKEDREELDHTRERLEASRERVGWATDGAQARAAEEAKILSWRQEDERAALETQIEDARKLGEWRERDSSRAPGMQAGRGEGRSQGQGLGQGQSHGGGRQGGGGLSR